jgi:hypothetical protein
VIRHPSRLSRWLVWQGVVCASIATTFLAIPTAAGAAEPGSIEGEVRAASVSEPPKTLVCAQLPTGKPEGCTSTLPDGTYLLPGLPPGDYKVQFIPAGSLYNLLNQFYDHESRFADADVLSLAAGETKTGIDADLEAGAEIRGTVYSAATGAPLQEVPVCALFVEEGGQEWRPKECVSTSSGGDYTLRSLPSTAYKVVFSLEFKDLFGGGEPEGEDDGYFTQFFNQKTTLAAADPLFLTAPEVRTGIDAHLVPKAGFPAPRLLLANLSGRPPGRKRKHCRPGLKLKRIAGKWHCVKPHKHRPRQHRH